MKPLIPSVIFYCLNNPSVISLKWSAMSIRWMFLNVMVEHWAFMSLHYCYSAVKKYLPPFPLQIIVLHLILDKNNPSKHKMLFMFLNNKFIY